MKDIKKMLKTEGKKILPSDEVKANIVNELGLERERVTSVAYAHGDTGGVSAKKKALIAAIAGVLVVAIVLGITLPLILGRMTGDPVRNPITDKFKTITTADEFYAYGAMSVGTILASSTGEAAASSGIVTPSSGMAQSSDVDAQIEDVNKYLALVESLLSDGNITETPISPVSGYEYGMKVSYSDLLGDSISYELYYDKEFLHGETEGDETEENYAISGILVIEGEQYPVEGKYETESESDGSESELFFTAYTSNDKRSYIKVEQEYETENESDENEVSVEYVYSTYESGGLVERTSVSYESENESDGSELELYVRVDNRRTGSVDELYFTDETQNSRRYIRVRGTLDGENVRFSVYIENGAYRYQFEDGTSSDHNRFDDDDDDDDDRGHGRRDD